MAKTDPIIMANSTFFEFLFDWSVAVWLVAANGLLFHAKYPHINGSPSIASHGRNQPVRERRKPRSDEKSSRALLAVTGADTSEHFITF